ncbi:MAG TPA: WbqC family protein [Pyrinomonadaceae bacterium]
MLVSIHQPEHLPWLGFFEKMQRADLFVLLDDVQFSKGDYQNRNRVKGANGPQWLSVPVVQHFPQKISEVAVAGNTWRSKHWKTLVSCYASAPHFETFAPMFENFYRRSWAKLADLNVAAIELLACALGIEKKWVFASELRVGGQKSELVLNICKALGAKGYYSGRTGSAYLDREAFRQAGVEIIVQNFNHPTYEQLFMKRQGFVPNLSALDLLFNCGTQGLGLITCGAEGGM